MPKIPQKAAFWLSFIAVLLAALLTRIYLLGQVPVALYWDEIAMYVDVKSVLQSGQDMFGRPWFQVIYPSYGDFKLPAYIWSALLSAKIFGLSEWSFRLPSALAGLGTVVVVGILARLLFTSLLPENKKKGVHFSRLTMPEMLQLVAMLFVAFTPWSIMFSRTGFEGNLGQFVLGLSMIFPFLVRKYPQRPWLLLLSPILGALATYAYFSVRFVWPVLFVFVILMNHFSNGVRFSLRWPDLLKFIKKGVFLGVLPLLVYGLLLLPMLKSPLYQDANRFRLGTDSVLNKDYVIQSNIYRQLAGNSRLDRVLFNSKTLMIQELLKNYSANMSFNFLFVSGDPNLRHGTGQDGLFLLFALPFFIYGIIRLFTANKLLWGFLVLWWLVALLPASVPENVPHALRSLNALVPLSLLITFGITDFLGCSYTWINSHVQSQKVKNITIGTSLTAFVLIFVFSVSRFLYVYFQSYPRASAHDWQDGYKQLAQALFDQRTDDENIIVVPFDDRFYLWLMAYGPYTATDFHSWKSDKYQFFTFGDEPINYQRITDESILAQRHTVLVGGRFAQMTEELARMKTQPVFKMEIEGRSPDEKFLVVRFDQP